MGFFSKKDVKFEYTTGQGPGGQHRNKTNSCVKATHIPTGVEVRIDGRKQHQNKKKALKELENLVKAYHEGLKAAAKKELRDNKIKNGCVIRTYDYKKNDVKDHRSGKHSDLKKFMKGKVNLEEFSKEDDPPNI